MTQWGALLAHRTPKARMLPFLAFVLFGPRVLLPRDLVTELRPGLSVSGGLVHLHPVGVDWEMLLELGKKMPLLRALLKAF